jgi:hypothetical protein
MAPATFFYERNEAVEELASGSDALFESRTRFLIFAVSVGFSRKNWVEDPGQEGEMRWSYIDQNQRLSVIAKALAYAHTKDPSAILDPQVQIDTLVGYGAGGARIIQAEVVEQPGSNLDNLIEFLNEHRGDKKDTEQRVGVLEEIQAEMSSLRAETEKID